MARRGKIRQDQKQQLGTRVLYIGNGSTRNCNSCGKGRTKGMMSQHKDEYYCSESCVIEHTVR